MNTHEPLTASERRTRKHGDQSICRRVANERLHDLNFSKDNRFKWREGEERVRAVNLLSNWADKSKVRNTIAWEAWANARHLASHWCFPVRVQQNAAFWGVYDMVENGDEDFLKRAGLDETSAFYKMYNALDNSTSNVEKKTREFEGNAELQALIDGLNTSVVLSTRRVYGYDNVDIPALINSLAVNALINNNDQGHKNYYLYRHTNGSGEWSLLPWDQDLAVGHTWTSGPNYFDDDIDSQRIVRNGVTNRLKSLAYDSPELNQMFVRRLRTLMGEMLVSANTTDGPMEQRMAQLVALVDPHDDSAAIGLDDADLDMELLRRELPKYGGLFVQCEDEISAVSMAIGAGYAGRVAVTGSSGPGISLKTEALGWASMAEMPVVIIDVQRGGPSTGMPTSVEQSDLNIACYGGHGDSPRVVLAPSSVEDCFYTAIEAVNIARKYSTPVVLLTDQGIATRIEAFPEPDLEHICQDISPNLTPVADHKPYDLSAPDGITRHLAPGTRVASGKYPVVTGLEHDELGHPSSSPKLHMQMTAKRRNKYRKLAA